MAKTDNPVINYIYMDTCFEQKCKSKKKKKCKDNTVHKRQPLQYIVLEKNGYLYAKINKLG